MPGKEQQERRLPELVVKEAVSAGMETPFREPILEAVEEADGSPSTARRLPLVGAALGIGASVGYLLGSHRDEPLDLGSMSPTGEGPEIVEEAVESVEAESIAPETTDDDGSKDGDGRRLPRIALVLAIAAGIALVRRRMKSDEADEWEPIEEFDTSVGDDSETEDESATDEAESEPEDEDSDAGEEGEEAET